MRGTWVVLVAASSALEAQTPQRHFTDGVDALRGKGPVISYTLTVAEGDTSGFDVRMTVKGARDTFRLAMYRHPEYHDEFHRNVENLRADARVTIALEDSMVWRVVAPGGDAIIDYRIRVPTEATPRAAWKPFLSATGGLVGGPHAFMYVVGSEHAPAHVEVRSPWPRISTGLTPTAAPNVFFAPNAYALVESPILGGRFSQSSFIVDGVPHFINYWGRPGRPAFDTTAFRDAIEKIVTQAVALFGRAPYREYHFQFQDEAWGGLEHHNSATMGIRSDLLRTNVYDEMPETAHEFIHTWNLVRIRPAEYVGVTYKQIRPVPTLWFSEGLTIFYSDLLMRRAGIPTDDSTRVQRMEGILVRQLSLPAHERFSAEQIARVAYNAREDALGDYVGSSHLMGEVLGSMLDLIIRDATNGERSMDQVMRLLFERATPTGITGADIERAVADVCKCVVAPFFATYVRGTTGRQIDFNTYLGLIGLKAAVTRDTVRQQSGALDPDRRVWSFTARGDTLLSLAINNPNTVYGRAGLHSGDKIITVNGSSLRTWNEFRSELVRWRVGDVVHFVVQDRRSGVTRDVPVRITGYDRPVVTITEIENATEKQKRLREAWRAGK